MSLLALLDCRHFLISTSGAKHEHPDRECNARLIASTPGTHLYFNYETDFNVVWKTKQLVRAHRYTTHYPDDGKEGLVVEL